ncbi:MaoC family dehydratase N-terminal domain-containing protein [Phaeovibrio sulfidiphilus]|uniref:MaoC family dehydratase N-terminal domain-containing protein n=1 Tax=Phaeovibrio sulfidiphilus TaxID=1220600 RepID=A0A8J6YNJ3_9PROT|nr:MaoC family dehydratase [Phaeovibrio sulfidiphilus]MBE1236202.1 MaoC family dehydratase N-terminal domain-containing protein [Phaeovibrio sulfidiphilus]
MDYKALMAFPIPEVVQTWTPRDAMFYALSVGVGRGRYERELDYVYEGRGPSVLPSYCVDLGHPGFWLANPETTVDATGVLHAAEGFTLHAPLPASGTVRSTTRIQDVVDRGPDRGAFIYTRKEVRCAESGRLLATVDRTVLLRRDGGYAGPSGTVRPALPLPEGEPDRVTENAVRPEQALLYRMNGDSNPLHADPEVAARAGFDGPILHGLCTFGMACSEVLFALADGDAARLRGFQARFSAPVFPGETLRFEIWKSGAVRVSSVERDQVVLSHAQAQLI